MDTFVKHRFAATIVALAAVSLLLAGSLVLTTAHAQQTQDGATRASAAVTIMQKVVLNETSIDAPAFFGNADMNTGEVIAWTGTDAAHHLNVMTSTDGLHYGQKITLGENSANRPGVVEMSSSAGGAVILAWRGTDGNHSLNVLFDMYGSRKKLTLWHENSFTSPAIAVFNGNLLLAWAGTDANHSLNVLPIALTSLTPGTKTVLPQFSAIPGPTLTVVTTGSGSSTVVLGWATSTTHLNLAQSSDGIHFNSALGSGLPQLSTSSPQMLYYQSEGGPEYWIAWTGTDGAHHLNVQWTSHYPQWPNPASTKTVLPELALGGPEIGFNQGMLIAWTGTDSAHHLNVARLQGF